MRAMVSRSATGSSEKKFRIAVAASDGRRDDPGNTPAQRGDMRGNVLAHGGMHRAIAHDAFLEMRAAGLELWLDQRNELRRHRRERQRSRQHQLERDEADVCSNDIWRSGELRG